jgi:hypothetical protein
MTLESETVIGISTDFQEKTDRTELFNQAVNYVGENHISSVIDNLHVFERLRVKEAYTRLPKDEYSLLEVLSLVELEDVLDEIEEKEVPCIQTLYFFRLITYGKVKIDVSQKDLKNLLKYIPQKMCKDGEMEEFQKHVEGKKNVVKNIFNF